MGLFHSTAVKTSRFVAHRTGPVGRTLFAIAGVYRKAYNNLDYDIATNGEAFLLGRLATTGIRCVFDVGANKGEYTLFCLDKFRDATVHAFEIVPETFGKLCRNVTSSRAKLNGFGLADRESVLPLRFNPDRDRSSSLVAGDPVQAGGWTTREVEVRTGDDYCRANGVDAIDLLKIDVEGAEHLVLAGFARSLAAGSIGALQFEFGMANIYSKFLLRDFYDLLERHGFVLGPIMPRGVDFRPYDTRQEDFQGPPNFLAVHRSKPQVIAAVRKAG